MILPGVSGGYLLLLLGQYVPILSAIDAFKEALKAGDVQAAMEPAIAVMLPVGIGVIAGVVLVGNPVMHHLFLGLDPVELGGAPFALATGLPVSCPARDLGMVT